MTCGWATSRLWPPPTNAAIQRQAQVAQARANQAAAQADQESQRAQAEYARQTTVLQAQLAQTEFSRQTSVVRAKARAEVDAADSDAAQSGPLAQAKAQHEVLAAQTELAVRNADLRQQQLVAEVIKPAEADAEKIRILAQADAQRTRIQSEAAASNNRVALDQLLIEQLPQIVREAAQGLARANVTVLNGSDGLGEIASGVRANIGSDISTEVVRNSDREPAPPISRP